jgi:hypothetical protein
MNSTGYEREARSLFGLLFLHILEGTEEKHENTQSGLPMSQPWFEPSTSRKEARSFTAWDKLLDPTHLILLDLFIIVFGEGCKLWSSSCSTSLNNRVCCTKFFGYSWKSVCILHFAVESQTLVWLLYETVAPIHYIIKFPIALKLLFGLLKDSLFGSISLTDE